MMNTSEKPLDEIEKRFLKRHWKMTIVFAAVFAAAATGALLVFLWFVANAQATGFVPTVLGQWTVGHLVNFILHVIFWEFLLVVSWVLVMVLVIIFQWYKRLPDEEREGWPKRGRREEGDAFGFMFAIAWLIVVWLDGRWNLAFESWTFNDWVYSCLAAAGWIFLIIGIPILIYFIWWIRKAMMEP